MAAPSGVKGTNGVLESLGDSPTEVGETPGGVLSYQSDRKEGLGEHAWIGPPAEYSNILAELLNAVGIQ